MARTRLTQLQDNFGVTSYTNTGNGGGTFYYINLGGIKLLWGQTTAQSYTSGSTVTAVLNFPASFFSTIQSIAVTSANVTGFSSSQIIYTTNAPTTSTVSIFGTNVGTQSGTVIINIFVIGT